MSADDLEVETPADRREFSVGDTGDGIAGVSGDQKRDGYTVAEAARLLGVSPKRVRQLVADGRLEAVETGPMRVSMAGTHDLRAERSEQAKPAPAPSADALALAMAAVEELTRSRESLERVYTERLAISDRREADLQAALTDARARADAAEAEARALREQVAEKPLAATVPVSNMLDTPRSRWWRRSSG